MPRFVESKRVSQSLTPTPTHVVRPAYNILELEHMGGISDIAPVLSYHQALISASQEKVQLEVKSALDKTKIDREKGEKILQEEKMVFDSITVSNTLIDYQNNILDLEQNSLEQDQYAQGHLERVTKGNKDLVQSYLSQFSGDADIQDALRSHFVQAYSKIASRAFEKEHIGTVAKANDELQQKANDIALLIAKGADPEQSLRTMDPIIETIPDYLPEKTKMVNDARNSLVMFSAMTIAQKNPELARLNLNDGDSIYSLLTPAQRLHVNDAIDAAIRVREHNNSIIESSVAAHNATTEGTELRNKVHKADNGTYTYSDLIRDAHSMNKYELKILKSHIDNYMMVSETQAEEDKTIAQGYRIFGSYAFLSDEKQKALFTRQVLSGTWQDENGNPIVDENGRPYPEYEGKILQNMAMELTKYTFNAEAFQTLLYKSAMSENPIQIKDSINAFNFLYNNHRIVLGTIDTPMNQQMLAMSSAASLAKNPIELHKVAENMQAVKSKDEIETLSNQFEGKDGNVKLWNPRNINVDGKPLDPFEDAAALALTRKMVKDYFLKTGDIGLAYQTANQFINSTYGPSIVNGPQVEVNMIGAPECFFDSSHAMDRQMLRSAFNNEAVSINKNRNVILNPSTEWGYNKCIVKTKIGNANGIYWYMPIPGMQGKYHVHYNYKLPFTKPFVELPISGSGPQIELDLGGKYWKGGHILTDQAGTPIVIDLYSATQNYTPKSAIEQMATSGESIQQSIKGELIR